MVTVESIMEKLAHLGSDQTKKVFVRHGAREPFFGVKIQDLKKIVSEVNKTNRAASRGMDGHDHIKLPTAHELALDLYATGNSDAMYLAGLLADPGKMTREILQQWAEQAYWYMLSDFTVAWVTSENPFGIELGLKWIDSNRELLASAGWNTLSSLVAIKPDSELDLNLIRNLIDRVKKDLHNSPNRVRHSMNYFLISVGTYIASLTETCKSAAVSIGKVSVNMGGTSCKVPYAPDYINKVISMGRLGKKRKRAGC